MWWFKPHHFSVSTEFLIFTCTLSFPERFPGTKESHKLVHLGHGGNIYSQAQKNTWTWWTNNFWMPVLSNVCAFKYNQGIC
jgi:hypothetical protein